MNDVTPETRGFDLNRPTIVALLILIGAVTGLPTLIGAILAYIWRGDAQVAPWEHSHFRFHIRGFWMTVIFVIISAVLTFISFGLLAWLFGVIVLWLVIRALVSLVKAQRHEPMPNPETLLW